MATAKNKNNRKHIYRGGTKRKVRKEFERRYGKKKGERVYGATVGKLKRGEAKKK